MAAPPLTRSSASVAAFASVAALCMASTHGAGATRSVLATAGQLENERQALKVLASPEIQSRIAALESRYLEHPLGATPAGRASARRAAESVAAAAVYSTVNHDSDRPVAFWGANPPHTWHGLVLPRAGYGIENPDNVYRHFHVDGRARYEVRGRFPGRGPAELHFVVMASVPGDTAMQIEGSQMLSTLRSDAIHFRRDRRFTISIDADPPDGRRNHLAIAPEGRFPVHVRDLFTDWAAQSPVALEVVRIAGPDAAPIRSQQNLVHEAARRLDSMGPFWLAFNDRFVYSLPANDVQTPRVRDGGRGFSTIGHFSLQGGENPADDEALIVTLDRLGAGSLGIQLADPWGVAYEYVDRTSSLNQIQSQANRDGSYTFVIAARDPGVHNWLDPEGQAAGIFVLRWQVLPPDATPAAAVRSVRLIKMSELRSALPPGVRLATPAQRRAQRSQRARAFNRRIGL